MSIQLRDKSTCKYDQISLGEVMLRLDPGEGRIRTARNFQVWEGGGEYNTSRGLRKCFGYKTAVVTAFVDNEVGHLVEDFIMQGGVDTDFIKWREDDGIGRYEFDSELGQPKFDSASIPMLTNHPLDQVVDYDLGVDGENFKVTALQMGNPNCCIFVDDFNGLDWRRIGKAIENHKQFPERTNVVFVRVKDRHHIELRIWERGVGETTASGTCSCAAAVAAMVRKETERAIEVEMQGGRAKIHWRDDGEVVITGTAEVIYAGQWLAPIG